MGPLPRPGLLGRSVRIAMALLLGLLVWALLTDLRILLDGSLPLAAPGFWILLGALVLFSSWVVNELVRRRWGIRPLLVLVAGAVLAAAAGWAMEGTVLAPPLGIYLWAWAFAFAALLGPAHLLAALLGTPGCEMRAYADLWTRLRGGDPRTVACPGWIDRFDAVRVLGRW